MRRGLRLARRGAVADSIASAGVVAMQGRASMASGAKASMTVGLSAKAANAHSAKASLDVTLGWTTRDFTGSNGAAWPSPFVQKASSSGSSATIQSNQGNIAFPNIADYGSLHGMGFTPASQNMEFTFDFIINSVTGEQYQRFYWRCVNPSGLNQTYLVGMVNDASNNKYIQVQEVDEFYNFVDKASATGLSWAVSDIWHFRVRMNGSDHKVRWWEDGDPEPGTWNAEFTDSTYTTGDVMLASQGGAAGVATRNHRYDNFAYLAL